MMANLLWLGGGAAALTAILILGKTTWPLVRKAVHIADAIDVIVGTDDALGIGERLDGIEYQLSPNDGKSLRDRVDFIGIQVSELQRYHEGGPQ